MNKLLRSNWIIAVLGIFLGVGTQLVVLLWRATEIEIEPAEAVVEPHAAIDRIAWSFLTPEIENLSGELRTRLEAVAVREEELNDYALRLKAERAEIEKLKRDMEIMRNDLSNVFTNVSVSEQKNLKTLAATYTNLSPAAALAIFQEMDDEMVVKILAFMKPDPVGQILQEMAQTKDGGGTLAGRAAELSNRLRLLRQATAEENT